MLIGKSGFVYAIDRGDGTIKVGMSSRPKDRKKQIEMELKFISVDSYISEEVGNYGDVEKEAHKILNEFRVGGEWFRCDIELGIKAIEDAVESMPYESSIAFNAPGFMKLSEHINLYHGGYITRFSTSIGESRQVVSNWLANSYAVDSDSILKVVKALPQCEVEHVKKVREHR